MKKKVLFVGGLTMAFAVSAFSIGFPISIPGIPQIVWDPKTMSAVMTDVAAALKIAALIESTKAYMHSKSGMIGILATIPLNPPKNMGGTTVGYPGAMSTGYGVQAAWERTALQLAPTIYFDRRNPRLLAMIASEEITEAAAKNAMQTHGQIAMQQANTGMVIKNFTNLASDTTPGTNSMVQQLNLVSIGTAQALNGQQVTNAAQEAQLELQLAAAKVKHDELAATIMYQSDVQGKFAAQQNTCVSCTLRPVIR